MAVNIRSDGYFEVEYVGPYGGLNVQMPENLIPDSQSPAFNDVILRNAELRSRPALNASFIAAPEVAVAIVGIGNFQGEPWALMADGKFYTFNYGTRVWTNVGTTGQTITSPGNLVVSRVFQNKLYFVTGLSKLSSWDGSTFTASVATLTSGPTNLGGAFLDELDNHLIMANILETNTGSSTTVAFPQRLRWSASGLPAVWDPTANINAGLNDFLEVPDNITGLMMLGRVGYILRTDGITEVAPTGNGVAPFDFNHLWASQFGIGSTKFYASTQYGTTGVILARDNIYSIQAFSLQPIGGTARDAILADVGVGSFATNSTSNAQQVCSIIVPYIKSDSIPDGALLPGQVAVSSNGSGTLPYFVYMLFVPKTTTSSVITGTNVWVYSFEDQSWSKWFLPGVAITGQPSLIYGSDPAGPGGTSPTGPLVAFPVLNNSGVYSIAVFNVTNFNDSAQGSSYSYKVEDIMSNRVPTVRRVILTYRDLGQATITLTLTGTDDNATIQSVTSPPITIGNTNPTGVLMTKFVDIALTAFRPQLTWNRAAGAGPVSIIKAVMIGTVEQEVTF